MSEPKMTSSLATVSESYWMEIGEKFQVDWSFIEPAQWISGCNHELEHLSTVLGNLNTVAQIALDHLQEAPDYYVKLQRLEVAQCQ